MGTPIPASRCSAPRPLTPADLALLITEGAQITAEGHRMRFASFGYRTLKFVPPQCRETAFISLFVRKLRVLSVLCG